MRSKAKEWGLPFDGSGMRRGLGNIKFISELNSAIAFLRLKNAIALFSSEMSYMLPSPHLIPRP